MNERQIALSVLEALREDLTYARLRNGSRVLDIADLRQYLYEQMDRVRTNAYLTAELYGNAGSTTEECIHRSGGNNSASIVRG